MAHELQDPSEMMSLAADREAQTISKHPGRAPSQSELQAESIMQSESILATERLDQSAGNLPDFTDSVKKLTNQRIATEQQQRYSDSLDQHNRLHSVRMS